MKDSLPTTKEKQHSLAFAAIVTGNTMLSVQYQKPIHHFHGFQMKREGGTVMQRSPMNSKKNRSRCSWIVYETRRTVVEGLG
jgi:hypothetical protein